MSEILSDENFIFFGRKFEITAKGIHVVGKGSWKKVGNFKVRKFEMKLERMKLENSDRSWKVQLKLDSDLWSWKVKIELERLNEVH